MLYLSHSWLAGSEKSLVSLLRGVNRDLFRPLVVTPREGWLTAEVQRIDVPSIITPLNALKAKNPIPYLQTVLKLVQLIRRNRIDVVHANLEVFNQCGLLAARLCRVPAICHLRNSYDKRGYQLDLVPWSDVLIANSMATAERYRAWFGRHQRLQIVHNAVDLEDFEPAKCSRVQARRNLKIAEDAFVLGVIGRLLPDKGQDIFLRALAKIKASVPNLRGLIVGQVVPDADGNVSAAGYDDFLRRLAVELGIGDRVHFLGSIENVAEIYKCVDVVVVPSRREPFGRVVAEALSMNKPVVATAVGGIPEIVEGEVTGLLVPPEDPESLAAAILSLAGDPDLCLRLGANGRRVAEARFSIASHAATIEQIYVGSVRK